MNIDASRVFLTKGEYNAWKQIKHFNCRKDYKGWSELCGDSNHIEGKDLR